MQKVEVIKIGEILRLNQKVPLIMIIKESNPIESHYINKLKNAIGDRYNILNTDGIIRPSGSNFVSSKILSDSSKNIYGVSDGDPIVGRAYTINNSLWHTSKIEEVIDTDLFITKNSVYALYNKSNMRENTLRDIGI